MIKCQNQKKAVKCKSCKDKLKKIYAKGFCSACYSRNLYAISPDRRIKQRKLANEWIKNNPERIKEIRLKAVKKWIKNNREKFNANQRAYYHKKINKK